MAEQEAVNFKVVGSSPTRGALTQLVGAFSLHPKGCRFESYMVHLLLHCMLHFLFTISDV